MSYANNKDADQPAHPRSLISICVILCLDRIVQNFKTSPVPEQAGLSLTWSQTPEDRFSRYVVQIIM